MREFLSLCIMPLNVFWVLLILTGVLVALKRKYSAKWLLFFSLFWLLIITTKFIPDILVIPLENQYPPLNLSDNKFDSTQVYIMILGGGHSDDLRLPHNDQLSGRALGRLVEGIRIHRLIPGSKLVMSGYRGRSSISQAEVLEQTAISLGVIPVNIEKLTTTRNTHDEAESFYKTYGVKGKLIVVTDAIHIPRAISLFRKAGLDPVAAPTNHLIKHGSVKKPFGWLPASGNIVKMEMAIHEWAGMVWMR